MLRYILSTASFKERLFHRLRGINSNSQSADESKNPSIWEEADFKGLGKCIILKTERARLLNQCPPSTVIHFYGRFPLLDSLLHFVGSRQILVWKWARWIRGARIQSMPWLNTFVCAAQKFGKVNSPASIGPWKYRYGEEEGGGGRWMWWTLKTQNWRKHFVILFSKTFDQFSKPSTKT